MKPDSARWTASATSPFPWEVEALAYLREALPDVDPIRVWSLFEFVSNDGNISEVDALVLTAKGLHLVEIKSHPWVLTGDASTWTWKLPDGKRRSHENPLLGANRKAKRLRSLLEKQKALQTHRLPFVQPLVFLSHQDVDVQLDVAARHYVHTRTTILPALNQLTEREHTDNRRTRIDTPLANAMGRAMEQAGIKPSRRQRRFGNYELDNIILEGPGYQDWLAHHASDARVQRRIRIYPTPPDADDPTRRMLHRAALREFKVLQGIHHEGILAAHEFHEGDQGPGVVFEPVDNAVRLDHFLADHGEPLAVSDCVDLLRQVAEAVQYVHEKRLVHRALSALSVLVHRRADGRLRTRVYNWQTAAREQASSTLTTTGTYTVHLDDLVDPAAAVYLAPEAAKDPTERAEHLDVFGLGSIAYRLFADRPPADDVHQLHDRLARDKGLLLPATEDGAHPARVELIRTATHPNVAKRWVSVGEFLAQLDKVEDELTRPPNEVHDNPTEAVVGQHFPGGFLIKRRLGKGSSAVVFLVEHKVNGNVEERVLKLALDPSKNRTLEDEAKLLNTLRHDAIVRFHDTLRVDGHVAILLDRAGSETLAERLRRDGRVALEHLQRFGEDLLDVLQYLDQQRVFHRDLKPNNIGVAPVDHSNSPRVVLFDFSLAGAPARSFQAGTPAYLDPFLDTPDRRKFDPAAERYAASVTLYEMTTGHLPVWGDGRSDPAAAEDVELNLKAHAFHDAFRDALTDFFATALHRDHRKRFATVRDMKAAWHLALQPADRPILRAQPVELGPDAYQRDYPKGDWFKIADFFNRLVRQGEGPFHGYRYVKECGSGGFGTAHLISPHGGGTPLVAKLPRTPSSAIEASAMRDEWLRERSRWAQLHIAFHYRYPVGVARVFRLSPPAYPAWILLEWVQGKSLAEWAGAHGCTDPREGLRVIHELARRLEGLANHGFGYVDLHERNVMLGSDNQPVLIDVGAARPPEQPPEWRGFRLRDLISDSGGPTKSLQVGLVWLLARLACLTLLGPDGSKKFVGNDDGVDASQAHLRLPPGDLPPCTQQDLLRAIGHRLGQSGRNAVDLELLTKLIWSGLSKTIRQRPQTPGVFAASLERCWRSR